MNTINGFDSTYYSSTDCDSDTCMQSCESESGDFSAQGEDNLVLNQNLNDLYVVTAENLDQNALISGIAEIDSLVDIHV